MRSSKGITWHTGGQSTTYRSQTRKGGKNALNIWLVNFSYLGIATFAWDYASNPKIDGIRVQYSSLPGGSATNFNLGKTASHEADHWFRALPHVPGWLHQHERLRVRHAGPEQRQQRLPDRPELLLAAGRGPIHNYMDYSYDSCYNQFTPARAPA